jgi:hypothetical protein
MIEMKPERGCRKLTNERTVRSEGCLLHDRDDPIVRAEIRALVEHVYVTGQGIGGCRSSVLAKTAHR